MAQRSAFAPGPLCDDPPDLPFIIFNELADILLTLLLAMRFSVLDVQDTPRPKQDRKIPGHFGAQNAQRLGGIKNRDGRIGEGRPFRAWPSASRVAIY
jgi:hypothetical protein